MTKTRNPAKKAKLQGRLFKGLAATVSLMAAAVPVVGAFENWFKSDGSSGGATSADYAKVCNLWDERHNEREGQLARFRAAFGHASDLTAARDALLLSTNQDITRNSELQNDLEALTPGSGLSSVQRRAERDWKANLLALREYRERLRAGLKSATQLEEIVTQYPALAIEARASEARGQLLRLGGSACSLAQVREPPTAHWSPTLEKELAELNKSTVVPAVPEHRSTPRTTLVATKHDSAPALPPETSASEKPAPLPAGKPMVPATREALPLPSEEVKK
jgi:hypothetical protein